MGAIRDLRLVASLLPPEEAGLLGYASGNDSWAAPPSFLRQLRRHAVPAKGGHVLVCTNPACRHEQFPRLDPAIIRIGSATASARYWAVSVVADRALFPPLPASSSPGIAGGCGGS